jgi:hypothetical protein
MTSGPIRVASIPSAHPYVRHLSDPDDNEVVRLPDPRPLVLGAGPEQWWPPRMLDLEWVERHRGEFDLVHVHFGFDDATVEDLRAWVGLLDTHRVPLVMTVHDLVNPHFSDPAAHQAQLGVLLPAAAELITLTNRAAAIIDRRWGRTPTVIPHPHIVPLDRIARPVVAHQNFVIGVHAKSLRANIDPLPVLQEIMSALGEMPGVVLRVDAHPEVFDPANPDPRAIALRKWAESVGGHPQVQVQVHRRLDDAQLWDYLQSIDLCILPYRFGTHSGWLEACVDLGTTVLVPEFGCYQDQHGHPGYGPGTAGLLDRVRAVVTDPDAYRSARPDRLLQRRAIARAHEHVYRRVLGNASTPRKKPVTHSVEIGHA